MLVVELGAMVAEIEEGVGIEVGSGPAKLKRFSPVGAFVVSGAEAIS